MLKLHVNFVVSAVITLPLSGIQDWALGVLHAKIIAAITLMGPQWWLKTVIEQVSLTFC